MYRQVYCICQSHVHVVPDAISWSLGKMGFAHTLLLSAEGFNKPPSYNALVINGGLL
ncbi:unnamed protein product [Dovyalis caffra]|uniref:Uncharacterized protein n=1 Tax=Dovyalis caffra TaxID=77055 RepID=A0AAV1RTB7_9ROSI|nr:unnamed protein product [Dovyalis caffra]